MKQPVLYISLLLFAGTAFAKENSSAALPVVRSNVDKEYSNLFEFYKHLHANPELSLHEEKTSQRVAEELRRIEGIHVTTNVGGFGVVGVFKNGSEPTILVRCDLDALPVKEQTGLSYASTTMTKDDWGKEVPVMHACGHDVHMTSLIGTARVLTQLKDQWSGTIVFIAQPAEERVGGAKMMLADGLFTRFPKPDFCLALHDAADLPVGTIGYNEGFVLANVDSVDITVRGVGGHGAYPHTTKDPIVLAAEIVVALQTIVSREIQPGEPAVVTVGSIQGGTKHNIIPDEVKLQLTLRSYSDEVRQQTIAAVKRIVRGQALSAGIPEDRLPELKFSEDYTPSTYNEPKLTQRLAGAWENWLGKTNVVKSKPTMGGEDFSQYGRTPEKIPCCIFWVGAVNPDLVAESKKTGKPLPSLHSPFFAPVVEPTIKTAITAMCAAVLELAEKNKSSPPFLAIALHRVILRAIVPLAILFNLPIFQSLIFGGVRLRRAVTFMMTSSQSRQSFLDFFKSKEHSIVPSSVLMSERQILSSQTQAS